MGVDARTLKDVNGKAFGQEIYDQGCIDHVNEHNRIKKFRKNASTTFNENLSANLTELIN